MTVMFFKRFREALIPRDQVGRDWLHRVKDGGYVRVEAVRSRSPEQHDLAWKLIRMALPNTDYAVAEDLMAWVKVRVGHFIETKDGFRIPKSIAFDNMPQAEFNEFFDGAQRLLAETLGVTLDDLKREVAA